MGETPTAHRSGPGTGPGPIGRRGPVGGIMDDIVDDISDDIVNVAASAGTGSMALVLAAGGGSRFDGPTHKLRAEIGANSVAALAVRHALDARIGPVVVVTGAVDLRAELGDVVRDGDPSLDVVDHAAWAEGQATSLRRGVAEAMRRDVDAIVVGLADQPFIDPVAWRLVAASDAPIAIATYAGRRRNPVRLHRSVWPLLPESGDEGARSVIRLHPELVEEVPCPGSPADIDTLEDLASWQNRSSTNSP